MTHGTDSVGLSFEEWIAWMQLWLNEILEQLDAEIAQSDGQAR